LEDLNAAYRPLAPRSARRSQCRHHGGGKSHGVRSQFPAHIGAPARGSARLCPAGRRDQRAVLHDQPAAAQPRLADGEPGGGLRLLHGPHDHTAERVGISVEKEDALWTYEASPLFSAAERAALRVAQGAAQVPNAVSNADFAELKRHYSDAQIVDIVAVIALFGFLNRFNDTMATELESSPIEAGKRFLSAKGWSVGKHAR
jgi:hypothetical protein